MSNGQWTMINFQVIYIPNLSAKVEKMYLTNFRDLQSYFQLVAKGLSLHAYFAYWINFQLFERNFLRKTLLYV